MQETTATFAILPDEMRVHIASYLDPRSLCFFAATNKDNLRIALNDLRKLQKALLTQFRLSTKSYSSICYTPHAIYICGENGYEQLGLGHKDECNSFTRAYNLPGTIQQVIAGDFYTLALTDQGLYARGTNNCGQLGLEHTSNCRDFTRLDDVPGKILQIAAGFEHICILTEQGLYTCGHNRCGELGLGHHHRNRNSKLTQVANLPGNILQIAAIGFYTLALTDQGLYVCGHNTFGQLGLGHNNDCNSFTKVENLPCTTEELISFVSGDYHTCLLTRQGLYVCGRNDGGQLGLGHRDHCNSFTRVTNLPGAVQQVIAGGYHTFMLTDQGLYACGYNSYGQLGLGHNTDCHTFTKVNHVPGTILQVIAGNYHTFLLTDQGLYACGYNNAGQLGLGDKRSYNTFTQVTQLPVEFEQFFARYRHINDLLKISGCLSLPQHSLEVFPPAKRARTR